MKIRQSRATTKSRPFCVLAAISTAFALSLSGCAASTPDSESDDTTTRTVTGEVSKRWNLDMNQSKYDQAKSDWDFWCTTKDALQGKTATVRDNEGKIVSVSDLAAASGRDFTVNNPRDNYYIVTGYCVNEFVVETSDSQFFTIEVQGLSGSVDLTRDELLAGPKLTAPKG